MTTSDAILFIVLVLAANFVCYDIGFKNGVKAICRQIDESLE